MGKGLDIMNKLGSAIDSYHKKGAKGSMKDPSPEHADIEKEASSPDKAAKALEDHSDEFDHSDGEITHHMGDEDLEDVLCPGCHDRMREHIIAKASGKK